MVETRPTTVNSRGSSDELHQISSSSAQGTLYTAALTKLAKELGYLLSYSETEEKSQGEEKEEGEVSLRSAMASMVLSTEMNKVAITDAQSSRVNSNLDINNALSEKLSNDYDDLLKQLKKLAKKSKFAKIFGKVKFLNSTAGQIAMIGLMALTGQYHMAVFMTAMLLLSTDFAGNGKNGFSYISKGLTEALATFLPKDIAQVIADTLITAAVVYVAVRTGNAAGIGSTATTLFAISTTSQMLLSTNYWSNLFTACGVDEEDKEGNKALMALQITTGVVGVLASIGVAFTATPAGGKPPSDGWRHYAEIGLLASIIGAGIGESIGSIGQGVYQIQIGKELEAKAEFMGGFEARKLAQESIEDDLANLTEHFNGLLQSSSTDFSDFGKMWGETTRAIQ
jgi:hypothetical protein